MRLACTWLTNEERWTFVKTIRNYVMFPPRCNSGLRPLGIYPANRGYLRPLFRGSELSTFTGVRNSSTIEYRTSTLSRKV
jgi:hypothetical protein